MVLACGGSPLTTCHPHLPRPPNPSPVRVRHCASPALLSRASRAPARRAAAHCCCCCPYSHQFNVLIIDIVTTATGPHRSAPCYPPRPRLPTLAVAHSSG